MIKQNIKIGPHNYVCELYKFNELDSQITGKFSLLRNIKVYNYIAIDVDIYVIDNDLIEIDANGNKTLKQGVIFPMSSTIEQYSNNISDFTNVDSLYPILDEQYEEKNIRCDKIRIYHPLTKVQNNDIIISVNNVINGITFHYITKLYSDCKYDSNTEFKVYNDTYSEYIEFYIPCVEDLISPTTYFLEDTNSCNINTSFTNYSNLIKHVKEGEDTKTYCSTYLFNVPFTIQNTEKIYIPEVKRCIENMYITYPINLILYPFSTVSEDGIYIAHDEYEANLDVFTLAPSFSLQAKLDFNDKGKLVVKSNFLYPESPDKTFNTVQEAYEYYNGVNIAEEYDDIYYEDRWEMEEFGDTLQFVKTPTTARTTIQQYQCVYNIQLASDISFKNVIYSSPNYHYDKLTTNLESNKNTLLNAVVNKEFEIPIFNDWAQLPEVLVCKVTFSDRYLGTQLESNFVVITKDYYKYLVNYEKDAMSIYKLENLQNMVKFYDKIVCNVKVNENTNENISGTNVGGARIIYKPIFYKTQDLQNIKIQGTVTQNIGINLSSYMTKVNTFYLVIDNVKFIETGRNDVYVIFNVQANKLTNTGGTYHVTNEEDEYISSGNWSIV